MLGWTPDRPRRVLYIDFENDPVGDIRERLQDMSIGPDDLGGLAYMSFPHLRMLDTPAGGQELLNAAQHHRCEVIVIDTVSRTVAGEENSNDTWLNFYRCTGLLLKQHGIACIRLDHTGRDESKGMRGGSAKSGDVDVAWQLSKINDTTFKLHAQVALPADARRADPHPASSQRAAAT